MNIADQVSVEWTVQHFGQMLRSTIAKRYGRFILDLGEFSILISRVAAAVCSPTIAKGHYPFPMLLTAIVIVKSGPGTFLSLAVYDNYIFWSDWGRRAILRSNKYTGGETKILRSDIPHQPMGIIAVANDTNSCELSPCALLNGGCHDLCLLTPDGRVNCSCRGDRILLANNRCVTKNSSCNIYSEFECGNGECVDYLLTCDGTPHCKDKSDEKLLYCENRSCRSGFKPCYNRRCIPHNKLCDGANDCGDSSDELDCKDFSLCLPVHYMLLSSIATFFYGLT
nr:low-density lipoprotein receptor-related protein 1B-like [Meriones unguiculatus]XP_021484117.1 low-density lipoprotein receptor-related protein 1B-like [Meriones unguiculatus]